MNFVPRMDMCEVIVVEGKARKWKLAPVSAVKAREIIRCPYCHGSVVLLKSFIRHDDPEESKTCMGGLEFQGLHSMSLRPVEA